MNESERFDVFLAERLETGPLSTEDVLAAVLPLLRQVIDTHAAGLVAPFEGTEELRVSDGKLWFEEAKRQPIRARRSRVRELERKQASAVEVVEEQRWVTDADTGREDVVNLRVGERGAVVEKPLYLPGYVSWEHEIGHHDPLTDVYSLGLVLASLACGLQLGDAEDLNVFASARRDLFRLNPDLNPVVARVISRMTELDRHRRPQDLPALLISLESYREQAVDFDLELQSVPGFREESLEGKRQLVLGRLRQRLFEISRRNRLLHFRPTLATANLTEASVPLVFDPSRIEESQLFTWNDALQAQVAGRETLRLSKHVRFEHALYLPSALDAIRSDVRRDRTEYGFAQLRLVACFLRWTDLKDTKQRYDSPLVLIPVELAKKKGVRDVYTVTFTSSEAEINPVVRHQLKELYGLDLPEAVDLTTTNLDRLHEYLVERIRATEPGIVLEKIERPRIDLIHARAQRRLDQYRRRARVSGRGVRNWRNLEYSYHPHNFHPLGLRIFDEMLRKSRTHLETILNDGAVPREQPPSADHAVAPQSSGPSRERELYSMRGSEDANPYRWEFDLCSLTLGNFNYRKMSLVRDYETLLSEELHNPAFDAVFSLAPRPVSESLAEAPPLEDSHHVVVCDPTQAEALGAARGGESYIIQGPPGTGKSQTITNLIADFVARGKRVLFVCEKRAAIDVVFHRLRVLGLGRLCSVIHDSQQDKKAVIMDLKESYESALSLKGRRLRSWERKRRRLLDELLAELAPIEAFDRAMRGTPEAAGLPVSQLLQRAIELGGQPLELDGVVRERLPHYGDWLACSERIDAVSGAITNLRGGEILASHPLNRLSAGVAGSERPVEHVSNLIARVRADLAGLERDLDEPGHARSGLAEAAATVAHAQRLAPLAERDLLELLGEAGRAVIRLEADLEETRRLVRTLEKASTRTTGWRDPLPARDTQLALDQARQFEGAFVSFLKPAWWRLRKILRQRFDFDSQVVKPSWSQVLEDLRREQEAREELAEAEERARERYGCTGGFLAFGAELENLRSRADELASGAAGLHAAILEKVSDARAVRSLAACGSTLRALEGGCDELLEARPDGFRELDAVLASMQEHVKELPDFLPCLLALAELPEPVARALRELPATLEGVEAAVIDLSLDLVHRAERSIERFTSGVRERHLERIARLHESWREANAGTILEAVQRRFLEKIKICETPAAGLTPEQKPFKKSYNRGRRTLEHEFGKTMRYRSLRDLLAQESGEVIQDLKPVWLMSPLSVSDTLPLDTEHFDVVIFDEASQIRLEEAVPSAFRATQVIVVGDQKQLPPTSFFASKRSEEEALMLEEDGALVEYDLESDSFLDHAARNLASTMLGWHYRSRSEALISFSNAAFYGGRLLTVPDAGPPLRQESEILVGGEPDGAVAAEELLGRPISYHFLEDGLYLKRRNRPEAEYVAELVRGLLMREGEDRPSIAIVAFSEAQQAEIERAIEELARTDRDFGALYEAELDREEDEQFAGLLIKNLENIQGDERDVIILSICYGPDTEGKVRMNFGPINQSGGERRLNVAFSRAKRHMAVVSSMHHHRITNDYNDGAACLKSYLRYAEAVSAGRPELARSVLGDVGAPDGDACADVAPVIDRIALALRERGYDVEIDVGESHFRCDLAVRELGDEAGRPVAVLVDTPRHYAQSDILERDVLKPGLLRAFGWRVERVLTREWHEDAESVLAGIEAKLRGAAEEEVERAPERGAGLVEPDLLTPDEDVVEDSIDDADELAVAEEAEGPVAEEHDSHPVPERESEGSAPTVGHERAAAADGDWRSFEFVSGGSRKFWQVRVVGSSHEVRYGRIGTDGQVRVKEHASPEAASRETDRMLRQKLAKGYVEK